MNIRILQLKEGARAAEGLTVVIDVFRAMTVEAYVLQNGAERLYPVGDVAFAYAYRDAHPGTILIGERGGVKCPGFDFGNSPSEVASVDFTGKTVIHTTSAGTQGIVLAKNATELLGGSLVTAKATAEYIKKQAPETVSLVAMGLAGNETTREDTLCAEYIRALLAGEPFDLSDGIEECRRTSGAKFFDPAKQLVFPEADFWLSVEADRFDFALKIVRCEDGLTRTIAVR